jgi:carotenoid 1,2-hydratase
VSRVEVAFERPAWRWQGRAYLDSNLGDAPLEDDFLRWDWLRAALPDGRTAVLYDGQRRDGTPFSIAQAFGPDGTALALDAPPAQALPPSGWRLERHARCGAGARPQVRQSLEDAPFYARCLLDTRIQGQDVTAVHESLDLRRFAAPVVQWMLPFRMRGWRHALALARNRAAASAR